jgi:hypothetical protein
MANETNATTEEYVPPNDEFIAEEEAQKKRDEENEYVTEDPFYSYEDKYLTEDEAETETEADDAESVGDGGGSDNEVVTPTAVPFNEGHFEWGRYLNLSREEVEGFGDPAVFERMINQVSSVVGDDNTPVEDTPVTGGFELGEDFEDEPISKMNDHYSSELSNMKAEINQLKNVNMALGQREQQRAAKSSADEFDRLCNTMDEGLFGRGTFDELGPESGNNRKTLANVVSRLGHGYAARGEVVPPMQQLVGEAFGAAFSNNIKNETLQRASAQSKKMRSQTSAVPTHREPEPLSADQKAIKAAHDWQKEHGWIA